MARLSSKRLPWIIGVVCVILAVVTVGEAQKIRRLVIYKRAIQDGSLLSVPAVGEIADVTFARAWMLSQQGRAQEALALYEALQHTPDPALKAKVKYQIGTLLLQQATALIEHEGAPAMMKAAPLIEIAKQMYREVLYYNSQDREAKYNLELALRLLPELERADRTAKEQANDEKGDWTTIPGLPQGMP